MHHPTDRIAHTMAFDRLCYTSRGALAGTRNSSVGPPHEGSIRRPIALWANALTTELHLAQFFNGILFGIMQPPICVPTWSVFDYQLTRVSVSFSVILCFCTSELYNKIQTTWLSSLLQQWVKCSDYILA